MQTEWLFLSVSFGRTDMDACTDLLFWIAPPWTKQGPTLFATHSILQSRLYPAYFQYPRSLFWSVALTFSFWTADRTRILTGSMWGEGELSLAGCSQTAFGICWGASCRRIWLSLRTLCVSTKRSTLRPTGWLLFSPRHGAWSAGEGEKMTIQETRLCSSSFTQRWQPWQRPKFYNFIGWSTCN